MSLPKANLISLLDVIQQAKHNTNGISIEAAKRMLKLTKRGLEDLLEHLGMVMLDEGMPGDYLDLAIEGDRLTMTFDLNLAQPVNLSEEDAIALIGALKWALSAKYADAGLINNIIHKISMNRNLNGLSIHHDDLQIIAVDDFSGSQFMKTLSEAISKSAEVHLSYFSQHSGETSERTVCPFRLYFREGVWYLRGFQKNLKSGKGGWRSFRLDRMKSCEMLDSTFNPGKLPNKDRGDSIFFFEEGSMTPTRTRFKAETARYIREMAYDGRIKEERGGLVFSYPVVGYPYFKSFILQFGSEAVVLEPKEYRQAIIDHLKTVQRQLPAK